MAKNNNTVDTISKPGRKDKSNLPKTDQPLSSNIDKTANDKESEDKKNWLSFMIGRKKNETPKEENTKEKS